MKQVINIGQLQMMTGGDAALAAEALGIFRQSAELWSRLLDPKAEPDHWADAAHGIKGAARAVGLMPLGEACDTAEAMGRTGSASPVETIVALSAVKDRLGEALEAIAQVEHLLMMKRSFDGVRLD